MLQRSIRFIMDQIPAHPESGHQRSNDHNRKMTGKIEIQICK
jgi:hypothetical protein